MRSPPRKHGSQKMDNPVVHLRLVNQDEIIGELEGTSNTELFILKPMMVTEVTDSKTQISTIVLSKYVLFDNEKAIHINKNHVITTTGMMDEIKSYYYNSLEYNTRFVEPVVRQELMKVNHVMEKILKQEAAALIQRPLKDDQEDTLRYVSPGSNTMH